MSRGLGFLRATATAGASTVDAAPRSLGKAMRRRRPCELPRQDAIAATPQQKTDENNYTYRENASSAGAESSCSAWAEGDISMARYVSQK